MLSSPRRPSNTMRIFSSAEYCLRVARRMSWTTFSAGSLDDRVCCLIFAPVNVTMSQKLSLLQSANSVSRALTADTQPCVCRNGCDGQGMEWAGCFPHFINPSDHLPDQGQPQL